MSQPLTTGWIQIATSGATIDGRTIDAQDLRDMAETYSTATYTAVIRFEHIRYFGNFGTVAKLGSATAPVSNWLAELPPEVAENIAFRNGERLFGASAR